MNFTVAVFHGSRKTPLRKCGSIMSNLDSSTKNSGQLTLIDKLSRLSYSQTLKLLGSDAPKLLRAGDKWDFRIEEDVYLGEDLFRLRFPPTAGETESARAAVTIRLAAESYDRLHWSCTACESLCEHIGAAFSLILDEKMTLGLAAAPPERVPVESLTEQELIERAVEERLERARAERMTVKSANPEQPWTDYTITSTISGKTYRVAVRGRGPGDSYCSCPDFRTNTLGACKHILRGCEAEAAVHGRAIEAAVHTQDDRRSRAIPR